MLSEDQVKRILLQCKRVDNAFGDIVPEGLQKEASRNEGWIQALNLVLEVSTHPIRNTPLTVDDFIEDEDLSNCCGASFGPPGWPDCDICSECGDHADTGEDE